MSDVEYVPPRRKRILVEEHKLYPAALKLLAEGRVVLKNGRAEFSAR